MKLTDKWRMSEWAYYQCLKGNDTQEMRDLITESFFNYMYCYMIKDIEEMWRKIKEEWWAYYYCYSIKDRPEVRKYITSKHDLRILKHKRIALIKNEDNK